MFEDAQMFGDGRQGHAMRLGQFGDALVAARKAFQDATTRRGSKSPEYIVEFG